MKKSDSPKRTAPEENTALIQMRVVPSLSERLARRAKARGMKSATLLRGLLIDWDQAESAKEEG